jgi:hypothetical protein
MTQLNNNGKNVTVLEEKGTVYEHEKIYYKPSYQYKRMLTVLFQDSPASLKEINNAEFTYKSLINLTVDYHNNVCKDRTCIDYTKSARQPIFIEPFLGFINSWMGFKTSKDYASDLKLYFGFNVRFKPYKGALSWDFLAGLNYSTNNFTGTFKTSIFPAPSGIKVVRTDSINVKYSIIRIPLMAEYTFPTKKLKPFLVMGVVNGIIINPEFTKVTTEYLETPLFRKYQLGALAGFGLKLQLNEKGYFYLKDEVEYRISSAKAGYYYDYQHVICNLVSFGYAIKLR